MSTEDSLSDSDCLDICVEALTGLDDKKYSDDDIKRILDTLAIWFDVK